MTSPVAFFFVAYFAGSINFSILLFRWLGLEDPRNRFSGNPGTTNVYRQAGSRWAGVVLFLDIGRAVGISLIASRYLNTVVLPWVGLSLIIGNRYPCFHAFRGGKGVANYIGFSSVIIPWFTLLALLSWIVVFKSVAKPFIASLVVVVILAMGTLFKIDLNLIGAGGVLLTVLLIIYGHRSNIVGLSETR